MVEKTPSLSVSNFPPNDCFRHGSIAGRRACLRAASPRGAKKHFPFLSALRSRALPLLALGLLPFGTSKVAAQNASGRQSQAAAASNRTSATAPAAKIALIKSFRIIQEKTGPALEILATHPMIPAIQQINDPTRLVIDLTNARLDTQQKRLSVQADQISAVRADQFQANPPVARIVLDLLAPRTYTWESAGNRLVVHLGKNPLETSHSPFQAPTMASLAPEPEPLLKSVRTAGPLSLATDAGSVGSSFTAGSDTAVLNLSSGGEVRVCPGTTLSITPSQNRHNLLLGMNTGALEAHLQLDASSDTVMTPDFRILLVGPGEFHYALSADSQGNTCVRALPGNTASAIVTELLGDRTYQVKATDQLVFRAGQLDRVDMNVPLECGCPPPRQRAQEIASNPPVESAAAKASLPPISVDPKTADSQPEPPAVAIPAGNSADATPPASVPNELHVQISAPLVFRATGPPPAPVEDVRALPLDVRGPQAPEPGVRPAPPVSSQSAKDASARPSAENHPHGFFHKLGHFFSSIFH